MKTSETPFSFNASCYTQEELESKRHNYELAKSEYTVLNIDYKQNGRGSATCGPYLKGQYDLRKESLRLRFILK